MWTSALGVISSLLVLTSDVSAQSFSFSFSVNSATGTSSADNSADPSSVAAIASDIQISWLKHAYTDESATVGSVLSFVFPEGHVFDSVLMFYIF